MDWYKWGYYEQGNGKALVRRYRRENGKVIWQTYPGHLYKGFNDDEIAALLRRLNAEKLAAAAVKRHYAVNHAYLNASSFDSFQDYLTSRRNNREDAAALAGIIQHYTLQYFVHEMKQPDPNTWKKFEIGFGKFLQASHISASYFQRVVQITNRFLKFLHNKWPNEVRLIRLDPVGSNVLKQQALLAPSRQKFVTDADFATMCSKLHKSVLPCVQIAYYFGLRRAEVLAITTDCLYVDALQLNAQVIQIGKLGPLKNREVRHVPYWFCSPSDAYKLIEAIKPMHPDTLGHLFADEMQRLGLSYQMHDLRRTFITRALRVHHYLDVKLAAGHSDLKTTNKYIQDDRALKREKFKP